MFSYHYSKQGLLRVSYNHKVIMHLKSKAAEKLYSQLQGCNNEEDIQMLLAKATGNFKRGNEKLAKLSANKKK
ncbi:MAG TPA: hypothetical protein PKC21_04645 [Oligoflexia bacterium]|nr:hypothetical protein [Oligoflexia bacterium]